jgi:hypothetical protein
MILDRFVGYIGPPLMHEHLQGARGEAIRCGRAVPVVAAAFAVPIYQIRVEAMGFDWPLESDDSSSRDKSEMIRMRPGVPNNTALIFSELMDAKSLFLTASADTIYFWINLNVTKGTNRRRDTAAVARRDRRHAVPVSYLFRPAQSRPGRRGQVLVRAARAHGRATGTRLLCAETPRVIHPP